MAQTVEIPGVGDVDFPDSMSKEQIVAAIQKLPTTKGVEANKGTPIYGDVPTVAGAKPNIVRYEKQPEARPSTMMDRVKAIYEVPTALVAPIATEPLSMLYGVGRSAVDAVMQGKPPSGEARDAYYRQAKQNISYQPTSPVSQEVLGNVGEALTEARLPPYLGAIGAIPSAIQKAPNVRPVVQESVMPAANRMAQTLRNEGQMIKEAVQPVANRVSQTIQPVTAKVNDMADALRAKVTVEAAPTMSGIGAAEVPLAVNRAQMAEQLRVPIKLSKGQATRDLGQQQFEAETMKTYPEDVGRPLIQAQEQRNALIGQNLDAYVDATGAKVANEFFLRPTAEAVDSALIESANKGRKAYKDAYTTARASEEGQQKVNVQGIVNQLDGMEAEAVNAPVINSAKIKLNQLAKNGEMTLNEIEEVRKMVNRLSGDTPSNMAFGGDIKKMIDVATENAGGDLFKEARRLRTKFANEFENIGLINDLLSKKANSKDRVVAMEKVFEKSVMQSDLDSLMALGRTLKKTPNGQQAWKELQGQTIENLRSAITKNIETDSLGQRTFSPKQFDVMVKDLDKSGKLDYMFGKSGAQEIRNLRDTVININSPVKGINSSNTSSAINKVFNGILKKTIGKVPLAGSLVEAGVEAIEKKNIAKQVENSLEFNAKDMANELRKGK
jgi:hypothetical protein